MCSFSKRFSKLIGNLILKANNYCVNFENYSYLWLDDRDFYMQSFLRYGHPLTIEEYENMSLDDTYAPPTVSPTMEQFKEQVNHFYFD